MKYDAFLSYSHSADDALAPALQSALHRLARPWNRLRALRIFRDKTSLSASPELWPAIVAALADARYFLLLASPAAASSRWVEKEVEWWLEHRSPQTMLILVTGGQLAWDDAANDFDWPRTDAIAPLLRGRFPSEPLWVDLRWARTGEALSLRHVQFRQAVLDVAAPLHGRSKDELDGEDVRQFARTRRLARAAIAGLVALTLSAVAAAWFAVRQRDEALRQSSIAQAGRLASQADLLRERGGPVDTSTMLAAEAVRLLDSIGERSLEADLALRRSLARQPHRLGDFVHYSGDQFAIASDGRHIAVNPVGNDASVYGTSGEVAGGCSREQIGTRLEAQGRPHFVFVEAVTASGSHCAIITLGSAETRQIGLWSAAPLEEIAVVPHRSDGNLRLALSEDAEYLAITDLAQAGGDTPGRFRIWSRSRRADVLTQTAADFVAFSRDKVLVAASNGIWRLPVVEQSTASRVLAWPRKPWQIVLSANGRFAATLDASTLAVWDLTSARLVREIRSQPGSLLAVHGNGRLLLLASPGAVVWDQEADEAVGTLAVEPVAGLFDGSGLIVITADRGIQRATIFAGGLGAGATARTSIDADETVHWLAIDGAEVSLLVEAAPEMRLDVWTPATATRATRIRVDRPSPLPTAVSADGRRFALGRPNGVLIGALSAAIPPLELALPGPPDALVLSADGEILGARVRDQLEIRNVRGGSWHAPLPAGVERVGVSGDGRYAAVVRRLDGPPTRKGDAFELVAWRTFAASPPVSVDLGRDITTPGLDCQAGVEGAALRVGTAIVDLAKAVVVPAQAGATSRPCEAITSATTSATIDDRQLLVIDRLGVPIARLDHPAAIQRAALGSDGRYAATLDERGVVRLWALVPRDLVTQACAQAPSPLDEAAWARYLPPTLVVDACGRARPAAGAPPP
ncbi:MAG: TIR domain-containing protein [Vicinamibacteraceae bacterium]